MFTRIFLFLVTNLAVIVLLNIILFGVEQYLGYPLQWYSYLIILAAVIGFGWSIFSLFISKWMAKKSYKLQLLDINTLNALPEKQQLVYRTVQDLAERNHIRLPEVWIYEWKDPNAFATGATKNSSLVAVSTGLLDTMTHDEIEWVVAHEMAHILNWDMVTMTLLQWVLNTFVIFASRVIGQLVSWMVDQKYSTLVYFTVAIVLEIIFGILASLIVMWFSRKREFRADEGSAKFVGKTKMIKALQALQKMQNQAPVDSGKFASMQISTRGKSGFKKLFSSHPDLSDRIRNIEDFIIR